MFPNPKGMASSPSTKVIMFQPPPLSGLGWEIDERHLFLLNDLLQLRQWNRTLEIGCLYGYSSSAFLNLPEGQIKEIHFCDPTISPELRKVIGERQVYIHPVNSLGVLTHNGPFDFVFVDGDHHANQVGKETELLLKLQPLVIVAHDTGLYAKCSDEWNTGPMILKSKVSLDPNYYTLEDNYDRPGEQTYRGLFFATTEHQLFQDAKRAFHKWTQH